MANALLPCLAIMAALAKARKELLGRVLTEAKQLEEACVELPFLTVGKHSTC